MLPLAAVSLGLGAAQSIGGFFGARNEASQRNQAAARQYRQQLKIYEQEYKFAQQRYGAQLQQYGDQLRSIDEAAALGYSRAQTQKNEALKAASFQTQDRLIQLARSTGSVSASGASGKSASRLDAGVMASFGRGQAKMAESLLSGDLRMQQDMQDITNQATSARNRAYSQVAIAPQKSKVPLSPTQVSGPNILDLGLDLGTNYIDSLKLNDSLMAPKV